MKLLALVVLGWVAVATTAHSASFDCSRSFDAVERLVCSNKVISELDDTLSIAYKKAHDVAKDKSALKISQRSWIKDTRDQCADQACLRLVYLKRIRELQGVVVSTSPDPLADIEGTYIISSPGCSIPVGGGYDGCPGVVDCLSIKRLSSDTAYINVISHQENGHMCQAEGLAKIPKSGILEITKLDNGYGDISAHPLDLDFFSDPMEFEGPKDTCGQRAAWYSVSFKKNDLKTKQALNCSKGEHLDSYLSSKGK